MDELLPLDLIRDLQRAGLEVRTDQPARLLYATDASIYQIEPLGVAFPKNDEQLSAAVELASRYKTPVLARGAGSSLAGQAIGRALILDCSRHLNRLLALDSTARTAVVEPGLVLANLNKAAAAHGLQFGPDPASAERATLGGSLANNATGAHSIWYGMAADHLLAAEVILADGSPARFEALPLAEARRRAVGSSLEAQTYAASLLVREQFAEHIRRDWPRVWRRASGYNLNYLLPWSPASPPGWEEWQDEPLNYPPLPPDTLNLAPLLAGSEGTLAVIRRAELRLAPLPPAALLVVLAYPTIAGACRATPGLLETGPSAVELIPQSLVRLAESVPAYAALARFVDELPGGREAQALLAVEFAGAALPPLFARLERLRRAAAGAGLLVIESPAAQKQVWAVRKVGLGLLSSRPGRLKSTAFMEDVAVPVEHLAEYVTELERLFAGHGVSADYYAHASAGCLHIRPLLDLKSSRGRDLMRALADGSMRIALGLGGAASGEHGDGLARSEWLPATFGEPLMSAFRQLKQAADPHNLLNPGKLPNTPPMDAGLRHDFYRQDLAWQPVMDFSRFLTPPPSPALENAAASYPPPSPAFENAAASYPPPFSSFENGGGQGGGENGAGQDGGLLDAVEMCNGAGVCRKEDGLMCPSFQTTRDETHATRGRANLLRALLTGQFPSTAAGQKAVYEALELCLACKGCTAECPSAVDMPRLKYEFLHHYYTSGAANRPWRDRLFAFIETYARLGQPLHALANPLLGWLPVRRLLERVVGLAAARPLPKLAAKRFSDCVSPPFPLPGRGAGGLGEVLFLSDAFTEYFEPAPGLAALRLLQAAGCRVRVLPQLGAGRTLLSKGYLPEAQAHARRVVETIHSLDPHGVLPVVGVEPSEIYTLCDEYPDLLPGDTYARLLSRRAWTVEEYLIRLPGSASPGVTSPPAPPPQEEGGKPLSPRERGWGEGALRPSPFGGGAGGEGEIFLHGHCYQKARPPADDGLPVGQAASAELLRIAGYSVQVLPTGCCGMAGAFGYEAEHHALSMQVAELSLLPALRLAGPGARVAASGVSCRAQIEDGVGVHARHPLEWAAM